jgi:hypothetical protein
MSQSREPPAGLVYHTVGLTNCAVSGCLVCRGHGFVVEKRKYHANKSAANRQIHITIISSSRHWAACAIAHTRMYVGVTV